MRPITSKDVSHTQQNVIFGEGEALHKDADELRALVETGRLCYSSNPISSPVSTTSETRYSNGPQTPRSTGDPWQCLMDRISSIEFGFVEVTDSCQSPGSPNDKQINRDSLLEVISHWQRCLVSEPQYDLNLGHAFLLLNEFDKAKQCYLRYGQLHPESSQCNTAFLYGLGLVYYHFDKDHREDALKCFNEIMKQQPQFMRGNEVMMRLGILHQKKGNYKTALELLDKVYADNRPCTLTPPEVLLYIGHIKAAMFMLSEALKVFESVIDGCDGQLKVKSIAYRQQALIYQRNPSLDGICSNRYLKAVELFQAALDVDPTCWITWFLLGKCYTEQGKIEDAFKAYKRSVECDSSRSEVWCATGVLYHQAGQSTDALAAYVSAAHLNPASFKSWYNMAVLYQSVGQEIDVLLCYENALKNATKGDVWQGELLMWIENIRARVPANYQPLLRRPSELPPLKEAWLTSVPRRVQQLITKPYEPILTLNLEQTSLFGSLPGREKKNPKAPDPIILHGQVGTACPGYRSPSEHQGGGVQLNPGYPSQESVQPWQPSQYQPYNGIHDQLSQIPVTHTSFFPPPVTAYNNMSQPTTQYPHQPVSQYPCHPSPQYPSQTVPNQCRPQTYSTTDVPFMSSHRHHVMQQPYQQQPVTSSSWTNDSMQTAVSPPPWINGGDLTGVLDVAKLKTPIATELNFSAKLTEDDTSRNVFDWIVNPTNEGGIDVSNSTTAHRKRCGDENLAYNKKVREVNPFPDSSSTYDPCLCPFPRNLSVVHNGTTVMDTTGNPLASTDSCSLSRSSVSPSSDTDLQTAPPSSGSNHSLSPQFE